MYDIAYARATDPDTSHAAAASISHILSDLEMNVLGYLCRMDCGGTTQEIADLAGLPRDSVSPRMKPLEQKGKVRRTKERRDGRIVWEALA